MSVPLLTPADTAIFDEDVLERMNLDERPVCDNPECHAAAVAWISMRCCNALSLTCALHLVEMMKLLTQWLLDPHEVVTCRRCQHGFPGTATPDDVVRVGDL